MARLCAQSGAQVGARWLFASAAAIGILMSGIASAAQVKDSMAHPKLFFTTADVARLKEICAGPMRPQFDELTRYADQHTADVPPAKLEGDNEEKGLKIEHPFLTNILDFSLLYVITSDGKYLTAAKNWTLTLARMDEWEGKVVPECKEGDRGLYTGFGLTALAAAYDWLYAEFTPAERAVIRAKIASRCDAIYRATFPEDVDKGGEWWGGAYLHHDLWIPVGGMGVAAMAVIDEVPDARRWAARAEEQFREALAMLGDDGAWHEGPCGWAFAMASFAPFWDAYSRRFPTRLSDSRWLQETWRFRLYSRMPDGRFISFGDGRDTGHYQWTAWQAAPTLRLLARKYANPYAQWLAQAEWDSRPNPYTAAWEIVWADTRVAAKEPYSLPLSEVFENQGLAILRTGWSPTDTVAAFHCDSLVGQVAAGYYESGDDRINTAVDHAHADANALAVWSRGDFALRNAGYGQRDTEFENTLIFGGRGQYRSFSRRERPGAPRGKITQSFASEFASFVEGDAARCYPPEVEEFSRAVFLVRPGVLFIRDSVKARKDTLAEWLFHFARDNGVTASTEGVESASPSLTTVLRLSAPSALAPLVTTDRLNKRVRFGEPKTGSSGVRLVALASVTDGEVISIDAPSAHSFVVKAGGRTVYAAFEADGELRVTEKLSGRGSAAFASVDNGRRGFLAVDTTRLDVDGVPVLAAPVPVTVSCGWGRETGELIISAHEPTQVAIDPGFPVAEVRTRGGKSAPHLDDGPRIILSVREGLTEYELAGGQPKAVGGN